MATALDLLKGVLGTSSEPIAQERDPKTSELKNLSSFLSQKESDSALLLEVLRAEATNNNEQVLPSRINNLSDEELLFLTSKFEEFSMEFRTFKQKLVPIEFVLENFNTELSQLSSSLVSLHQQSNQLSHNLDSQKGTIEKLNPIIVDLIIPTDMVQSILSGNVDASWIENLRFINEKLMLIKQLEEEKLEERLITLYKDSEAFKQLKEGIDILVVKATERIRDYMIIQIKHLRSSTSESSQKIQQNLLSVKEAFAFLKFHQPKLADQLQLAYFYTMRWYYGSRFSKYLYALQKLNLRHVDSTMVLGADGATGTEDKLGYIGGGLKSWIYAGGSSANSQSSPTSFQHNKVTLLEYLGSVDKRLEIINTNLEDLHKSAMPAQIAETTPFGYWVEFVFNQWFTALLDNVVVEYLFVVEFFFQGEEKYHTVEFSNPVTGEPEKKDWSLLMFDNVYKVGREFLSWLITHMPSIFSAANRASTTLNSSRMTHTFQGSCDVYALLLMIRIIQTSSIQLHNQFHIPVLEDHINSLLLILWPQFTRVIDLNCDAMKKTIIRIGGNKGNLAPSSLTQQFGQMLSGLLKLSIIDVDGTRKIETLRGEPLYTSITRLRNDFENTLTKVSNQVKNPTDKEIFLYNNYFLIVNILKNENQDTSNDFINEQIDHFEKLCKAYENS